jgi:hypothetical protein
MPQGLWIVPRWLGIEIAPAAVLVLVEMLGLLARSAFWFVVLTLLVGMWYWLLREAFARDEQMIALLLHNRHFLRLDTMRDEALVSSRVEHLEQVL